MTAGELTCAGRRDGGLLVQLRDFLFTAALQVIVGRLQLDHLRKQQLSSSLHRKESAENKLYSQEPESQRDSCYFIL